MCGHVGIAGNLLYQDEFTLKRLLLFDYFRGPDSTGLGAIRSNGDAVVAKLPSHPIDLFNYEPFKKALNGNASRAFIGHNRLATRGGVSSFNAHPFHIDHIVGAHNGTLDYETVRRLEAATDEKFIVDSRALFTSFAKIGVEETIKLCNEGRDNKDGAWALVWFDQIKGTMNFLRNKHRDLFYCYEEGFKKMFWASEFWMLREALNGSPNGYKIYTEKTKEGNVGFFTFEPDIWYEFDLEELCAGSKKRPKPKARPLKGKEPAPVLSSSGKVDPFDRHKEWFANQGTSGTHTGNVGSQKYPNGKTTTSLGQPSDRKTNIIQLIADEKHPYANMMEEEKFLPMAAQGCAWCKKPVNFGDLGITVYERDGRVLCKTCSGYHEDDVAPAIKIYVRGSVIDALS